MSWKLHKPTRLGKLEFLISLFIRATLIAAGFSAIVAGRWTTLFVTALTFLLTFLPHAFERRYRIRIPVEFEIIILIFIYSGIFLGEVLDYYHRFWWWDVILHISSAMVFALIGFIILYVLLQGAKVQASPIVLVIFSFCFAIAIGAVWEIFEFSMDQIFGFNMQKSGLRDTMWDLIIDGIGAFLVSILGYFYLKGSRGSLFDRVLRRIARENPKFFKD